MSAAARHRLGALVLCACALAWLAPPALAAEGSRFRPAVRGRLGVVATESRPAAAVGVRVLERGGNAVDAAVATVFALNVSRPQSCGIGGGGFAVYRSATGRIASVDFRETAPRTFRPTTLVPAGLHKSFTGHLTVGVPGTVAGMDLLLHEFGTWTLAQAIGPSIPLARRGVRVTRSLSASMAANARRLRMFPATARTYLRRGRPYPPGSLLRQPALASTLELIARHGAGVLYRGRIAGLIVADMRTAHRRRGDAARLALGDFARYRARLRRPLVGAYRGYTLITVPPPSSGGTTLLEILNILAGYDLRSAGFGKLNTLHVIAEAEKLAWADRNAYVADPDRIRVPTAGLVSRGYAARRRALIAPLRAGSYGPGRPPSSASPHALSDETNPAGSTTHVSVIDARGNAVAVTCTIEQEFGSAVVAPRTGFLLNNELTDFGDPGTANQPGPGKRPRSSIAPTIMVRGRTPVMVIGAAGGARIIMGVVESIINFVDFRQDLAHALDAPRLDDAAGMLVIEQSRLPGDVISQLILRGHKVSGVGEYDTRPRVQAAGTRPGGIREAVTDPRADAGSLAQRSAP